MKVKQSYLVFLTIVAAMGGLLYGYDTAVISGTVDMVSSKYGLDTMMQGWYVGCALIGSILGASFAGMLSDKCGRRPVLLLSSLLFTVSAIGCALTPSFAALVGFRFIGGMGIGIVSIVAPVYISEIAITQYRGRMVGSYQLAITVGFLLAYLVNYLLLLQSQTAHFGNGWLQLVFGTEVWRGMLGANTVPALMFVAMLMMIPESPRWLIVKNNVGRAKSILGNIYASPSDVDRQVEETQETLRNAPKSEWRMLLRPGIRGAVVIGCAIAILGQFMGVNAVLYYGPSIFADAGFDDPLFCQVLVGIVNMLTTVIAMMIIDKVGRHQLIYWGVSGMIVSLLCISFYFQFGHSVGLSFYFMLAFFLLYVFCCAISICAVVNVLLSEMYPNSVRGLAMSIAGFSLWIGTYLIGQLTPWMLENLTPQGTFLLFAVMCVPYVLIMWRLVPETAGLSLEDIERYWTEGKKPSDVKEMRRQAAERNKA